MIAIPSSPTPLGLSRPALAPDLLGALVVAVFGILLAASAGFARLADAGGDNDSLLRLVQVRDLIAGQAWFDPMQYRMGLDGGFAMHWSRLVDAPVATLVKIATAITGSAPLGESIALVVWPAVLLGCGTFLLVRIARAVHGPDSGFPALVIGALALVSTGLFESGAVDHHNVQLVLTLGMGLGLVTGGTARGAAAGACGALMLAVGVETLPYVAVGGAVAAILFLLKGRAEAATAVGFGLGFAGVAAIAFVATVPASRWTVPACDAYSLAQLTVAVVAGAGLALIAATRGLSTNARSRTAALAALAAGTGVLVILAFPQCLADPYAALDQRLRTFWLDGVTEAQSVVEIARKDPAMLAIWYATPLLGLLLAAGAAIRGNANHGVAVIGAMLLAAVLVSMWQVRGAVFAVALAVVPLAGWVARRRSATEASPSPRATASLALAWILSFNAVWSGAGERLLRPDQPTGAIRSAEAAGACYRAADFAALASLPPTTVLAVSNLGSAILANTPHRALAGPYHRNVAGNLAALDLLLATPSAAEDLARRMGVGIVAVCPGNPETSLLERAAPGGLLAGLRAGETPRWLESVGGDAPLRLYRVTAP